MRYGRYIPDTGDVQPGALQGADGSLAAASGTLDDYLHLFQPVFRRRGL